MAKMAEEPYSLGLHITYTAHIRDYFTPAPPPPPSPGSALTSIASRIRFKYLEQYNLLLRQEINTVLS